MIQPLFRKKVYIYILYNHQLLVFQHVDFPEAGIQVPGGTVEPGESICAAALREVKEETGLKELSMGREIGVVTHDMSKFGLDEIHERHYFLMTCKENPLETWVAYEQTPSDGSEAPIAFKFYWVRLEDIPTLAGETDEMLGRLTAG